MSNDLNQQNPWHIEEPFDAMFSECIALNGKRTTGNISLSASACVFPSTITDPFAEEDTGSTLEQIVAIVRQSELSVKPQQGDVISVLTEDGTWNVNDVKKEQNWYKITARGN